MYTRLTSIINELISLGEVIPRCKIVRRIVSKLPPPWDSKVIVIIKARNLSTMTLDDLIGNLKTYELKHNQNQLDRQFAKP